MLPMGHRKKYSNNLISAKMSINSSEHGHTMINANMIAMFAPQSVPLPFHLKQLRKMKVENKKPWMINVKDSALRSVDFTLYTL